MLGVYAVKRGKFESGHTQFDEKKTKDSVSEAEKTGSFLQYLHDLIYLLGIIMIALLLFLRVVIVSGSSMEDTLVDGDYLLLLNNTFYSEPKQGDIVVAVKDSFREGEPIIKRVIAVGGQTVDIDFNNGSVYVDGTALSEDYISSPTELEEGVAFPLTVDEGCVFVLGDNRMGSQDSRSPDIGLIDNREILGKVLILIFPGNDGGNETRNFGRIGVLP